MNRYLAIDVFRGMTIALMIIVNTPGNWQFVYDPLEHAAWHGCTPTDLVFPSFMFIIGVSMWFSFAKYERKWSTEVGIKILRRTVLLFLVGLILNKFPFLWKDWDSWRIMGVPQRLALGYGIGSVLALNLNKKALIGVSAALLLGYWGLLNVYHVLGADPYSLIGNGVLRLDLLLFGPKHLYHGEGLPFDPEGVLSTIPAVATVLLGWLSGQLIGERGDQKNALVRDLLTWGVVLGATGLLWDLVFPINKKLWTSSYVLYVGGIAMIALSACIWWIDVKGRHFGTHFFRVFGANALFAYVLSEAVVIAWYNSTWTDANGAEWNVQKWIYQTIFAPIQGQEFSSFLFAIVYMLLCWLVCKVLYDRKIFIKL